MDSHSRKICIFKEFRPFLRLLTAYNRNNFRHQNPRRNMHSVFYALFTTLLIPLLPLLIILGFWYLFENGSDSRKIIVGFPVIISIVLTALTFIALVVKNRRISETINEMQKMVNQRKLFSCPFTLACLSYLNNREKYIVPIIGFLLE